MTQTQLTAALESPSTPMLELSIASILEKGVKNGDAMRLAFLLDRAIGKPAVIEAAEGTGRIEIAMAYSPEARMLNGRQETVGPPAKADDRPD